MTDIKADDKALENGLYRSIGNPSETYKGAKRLLIIAGKANNDVIASCISLALYLKDIFNKDAEIVCFDDMSMVSPELLNLYKIDPQFESMILRIVVDHSGTKLDSLNYYKDAENDDKLILDIKPINKEFDPEKRITFSKEGLDYDAIVTVGLSEMPSLGQNYIDNETMFEKASIVNYDITRDNKRYGKINVIDTSVSHLTKLIFNQFLENRYTPDIKTSKALLIGLSS